MHQEEDTNSEDEGQVMENQRIKDLYAMFHQRDQEEQHYLNEIDSLKKEVQTLQKELKVCKASEETLKEKLKTLQTDNEILQHSCHIERVESHQREKELKKLLEQKTQENDKLHEREKQYLVTVKSAKECVASNMTKHFAERMAEERERHERMVKMQERSHESEVAHLKEKFSQLETERRNTVEELKHEIMTKIHHLEEERKHREADRVKNQTRIKELEVKVEKQAQTIRELTHFSTMKETVQQKKMALQAKEEQIAVLQRGKREVSDELWQEKDKNAVLLESVTELRQHIRCLEDKLCDEQQKVEDKHSQLRETVLANQHLSNTLAILQTKGKTGKQELKKMEAMMSRGQALQLHFQHDLQACMNVIEQPRELRSTVMEMKKLYVDKCEMKVDSDTMSAYEHQIHRLQQRFDRSEAVRKSLCQKNAHLKKQVFQLHCDKSESNSYFIGLLNEKIVENDQLTKDVQKANKTKRLGSCTKKKVHRVSPTSSTSITDQPPFLYPDTWEPPVLCLSPVQPTEDTALSPEPSPPPSLPPPSSSPPPPPPLPTPRSPICITRIHVKPQK